VQPGTEEPRDLAFLQQLATQRSAAAPSASVATRAPGAAPAVAAQPAVQQAAAGNAPASAPPTQTGDLPPLERRDPAVEAPRAGVNSMFGL
jgi:hypothetical protein